MGIVAVIFLFFSVLCLPMAFDEHGSRRQKILFRILAFVFWFGFVSVAML